MLKTGLIVCLLAITATAEDVTKCSQPADIAFLIDDSRSIWPPHFTIMLDFIQQLMTEFDIAQDKTRIAAATFSRGAREEFAFTAYNTYAEVDQGLSTIVQSAGDQTQTWLGLRLIKDAIFKDARKGVPHVLIVLTDGESSDRAETFKAANETRDAGIEIFVIGIGRMDKAQMLEVASNPDDKHFFEVDDFPGLDSIQSLVATRACQAIAPTDPIMDKPTAQKECLQKPAEIVLVIDRSTSIYVLDFQKQLDFLKDLVDIFDIACDKTRVSTVTFSTNATVQFHLNDHCDDKQDVKEAIGKIPWIGGVTETAQALRLVTNSVLTSTHGVRSDVPHVVIVITDGQSQKFLDTRAEAKKLKDTGAAVFAIGVGDDVDKQELMDIGSTPSDDFVFEMSGYDALPSIKNLLAFKACEQTSNNP